MSTTLQDLSSEIRHFSAELKRLEQRLKSEPPPTRYFERVSASRGQCAADGLERKRTHQRGAH